MKKKFSLISKKKYLSFAVLFFILAVGFGNCSPSQLSTNDTTSNANTLNTTPATEVPTTSLGNIEFVAKGVLPTNLRMLEIPHQIPSDASNNQTILLRLLVDFSTEKFLIMQGNRLVKETCLPKNWIAYFKNFLFKYPQICEKRVTDRICTQQVQSPTNIIYLTDGSSLKFGAGTNGCGHMALSFCGSSDANFRNALESLKAQYGTFSCPSQ